MSGPYALTENFYSNGQTFANISTDKLANYPASTTAATAPTVYPDTVSINGRRFTIDTSFEPYRREAFRHRTILPQRQSINFENIAGYGTLNTEGLWRRDQLDWSHGAGQQFLDRKAESDSSRFYKSRGINVWTESQATLLNDTAQRVAPSSSTTNIKGITVGNYVYVMDQPTSGNGTVKWYKTNWGSAGTSGTISLSAIGSSFTLYDICTNGSLIWLAASNGIWTFDGTIAPGGGTPTVTNFCTTGAITSSTMVISNCTWSAGGNNLINANGFPNVSTGMTVSGPWGAAGATATSKVTSVSPTGQSIGIQGVTTVSSGTGISTQPLTFTLTNGYTISKYTMVAICNNTLIAAAASSSTDSNCLLGFVTPSTANAAPDSSQVLMIHPSNAFRWTCAVGGETQIYLGGYVTTNVNGTLGMIFRSSMTGVTSNTTVNQAFDLNYPIQTLPLAVGEYPTAMYAYLNYIFIGTNLGIRMAQTLSAYDPNANATGDLKSGPLQPNLLQSVTCPVRGIVGNNRYIYFSWSNYDTGVTGIGRMDLSQSIGDQPLTAAYASDLMVTTATPGEVTWLDWDPWRNMPLMSISATLAFTSGALGVYGGMTTTPVSGLSGDAHTYVASGTIDTGGITYGIVEDKIPVKFDASVALGSTTMGVNLNFFHTTGPSQNVNVGPFSGTEITFNSSVTQLPRSERINVVVTLNSDATQTFTPILYRYTMKSWPAVVSETNITPVIQFFRQNLAGAQVEYMDPYDAFNFLQQLLQNQTIVPYVEGPLSANVIVEAMDWLPHKINSTYENGFIGDCVVTLKTIGGYTYTPAGTT